MLLFFSKPLFSLFLFATLLMSVDGFAKTHPFDAKFEGQVRSLLYEGNQLSQAKVEAYAAKLEQKRLEVVGLTSDGKVAKNSILISKYLKNGKAPSDLKERLEKHETKQAFVYAIAQIRSINARTSYQDVLKAAYNALDIEASVQIEGDRTIPQLFVELAKAVLINWKIQKVSAPSEEASNLFDRRKNSYLSAQDIAALKQKGADLSAYGPVQSTFWQDQGDISKVDIQQARNGANLELYKNVKIEFPADNTFYIEEVKRSDTKPKVDAYAKTADGKKSKFKLKFGAELHSDPTAAALMMALGYPTDVTRYSRNIKLIIGKMPITEFIRDWEVYYQRSNTRNKFLFEDQVINSGQTPDGQNFILFKDGLIEAKPKGIDRLGPWAYSGNGHNSLREVRALSFIQIWLDNNDATDFVNNRLLVKGSAQDLQKFHVISDPGKSLGSIFGSKPELYGSKIVTSNSEKEIVLSYINLTNGVKNKITMSDARWATRLIAALTVEQIATAVQIGGWNKCLADQYVYKMISRRNDLVKNFGLLGERLPNGQVIGLLPVNDQARDLGFDGSCDKKQLKAESSYDFDFNFGFLVAPLVESTRNLILDSARGAISSLERVVIKSDRFKTELNPIAEIIIEPKREIERNMNPTSAEDQFIVKEYLRVGIRYGVAYGAYVDNIYTIAFSLAYPVRSMEEARLNKGFVVNALLPRDILKNNLPASYVLMTEHSFEFGAGVNFDQRVAPAPFSMRAGVGEVSLHRSVLDHRDANKAVFYREYSKFDRATLEAFLGVSLFRIPLLRSYKDNNGQATGVGFILSPDQLKERGTELLAAIVNGSFEKFSSLEKSFDLKNRFSSKSKAWNFIFLKSQSEKRLDNIVLDQADQTKSYTQYREYRSRTRSILSNSEVRNVNIEVYSSPSQTNKFQINLSIIGLDSNVLDKELDLDYLGFINGLSIDNEPVIPFSPSLQYSTTGSWGDMIMNSDTFYYPAGVDRIMSVTPVQFWKALAQSMKLTDSELQLLKSKFARFEKYKKASGSSPRGIKAADRSLLKSAGLSRAEAEIMSQSYAFLKDVASTLSEKSLDKKVKRLAEAIRKTVFVTPRGFFESRVLGALNRLAGEENFYSVNTVSTPQFTEVNLIEEQPLKGHIGKKQDTKLDYLVFTPITPADLYFIFDSWF
jgi:hypothetical protein